VRADKPRLSNQKKNPQDKDSAMNMDEGVWKLRKHHSCEEVASAEARDDNRENEARHCGKKYVVSSHSGLADHHRGHELPPDESISRTISLRQPNSSDWSDGLAPAFTLGLGNSVRFLIIDSIAALQSRLS
jgi:hypothetical protein